MSTIQKSLWEAILLFLLASSLTAAPVDQLASPSVHSEPSNNYWAFKLPARPAIPEVKQKSWPSSPLDQFILAKLEEKGIAPAPKAEKSALLRRATFDLHGLPPAPAELDAFLTDKSPRAFAKVVDRLLASPRYGERWGRHWLDVARFAESQGFEYDKIRENAWRYRDYVIASFNSDKPYFQFVKEQIAGDALPPVSGEGITATGFLVAGPYDEAGNTSASALLKARIREEELEDIIAAVGQTFLGLTINCARCHDHKFDPILQRDYYRIKAAFDGVHHGERSLLAPEESKIRESRQAQLRTRITGLESQLQELERRARARAATSKQQEKFESSTSGSPSQSPSPMARWTFDTDAKDSLGNLHGSLEGGARIAHGRLVLNGESAFVRTEPLPRQLREKTLEAWVALPELVQRGGGVLAVETKDGGRFDGIVFGEREPRKWSAGSSFFQRTRELTAPLETAGSNELVHLAIVYATDNSIAAYRNGIPYSEPYTPTGENAGLQIYPANKSRVLFGLRHTGAAKGFFHGEIEEAQLYDRALSAGEIAASARAHGLRILTPEQLLNALTLQERDERSRLQADLESQRANLNDLAQTPQAYAATSRQPEATFVLARGDVESKKEPIVAGGLSAISSLPMDFGLRADAPEQERRVKLANWIGNPANPLSARVFVNRVWHYHFGRGIVGTPNDFGLNGERPSHPELLDYLATEFIAHGGSTKQLHRLIMLSSTYQQSGEIGPAARLPQSKKDKGNSLTKLTALEIDAEDHLLWHFPLRRLEGEAVRDAMLSVSGQLNLKLGGASYRPFTVFVSNSHFYNLTDPIGPEYNRRTLYRMTVHSGRDPLLDSLDCPDPSTKTPVRGVTTTPIQSMGLMNDPFIQRQAHNFANRLQQEAGASGAAQIKLAWRLALARFPRKEETVRAQTLAREHGMESVCWALLNASEFLYVR